MGFNYFDQIEGCTNLCHAHAAEFSLQSHPANVDAYQQIGVRERSGLRQNTQNDIGNGIVISQCLGLESFEPLKRSVLALGI